MAQPQSASNTMGEELMKLLKQLAVMETMPDADLDFIQNTLRPTILAKVREPLDQQFAAGNSQVPPPPLDGGMGGGMAGLMGGMGGGGAPGPPPGPPMGGMRMGTDGGGGMVDELRRMLGS